jgi:Ca2+-binding EF-hand superfamily protein
VNAQFSRYDQNGDGFIERDEVQSANQPPASEPPKQ